MHTIRILIAFMLLPLAVARAQQPTVDVGGAVFLIPPSADDPASAPVVLPPAFRTDGSGASFQWERPAVSPSATVTYQVLFCAGKDTLLYLSTPELQCSWQDSRHPLYQGHLYALTVSARVEEHGAGYFLPGRAYPFEYLPNCYAPLNPVVSLTTLGAYAFTWQPNPANIGQVWYRIRYKIGSGAQQTVWKTTTSFTVNDAPCQTITANIATQCITLNDVTSDQVDFNVVSDCVYDPPPPVIAPHLCGDPAIYTGCAGGLITNPNQQFTTIAINDFPITVTTNTYQGGVWIGSGTMPLPFGNASVKVTWHNLKIAKNYRVCEGQVLGVSDDPQYFPNLAPGPVPFGGEICQPLPSAPGFNSQGIHSVTGLPWNQSGFGPTGTYDRQPPYPGYAPGMPFDTTRMYDPNGFNTVGIHALTGTQYNPEGCNAQGVDASGKLCDPKTAPYTWLNTTNNQPTEEGAVFAEQVKDSLKAKVTVVLQQLQTLYQDSLTLQTANCMGVRFDMDGKLGALGFDRAFIYGPGDIYFSPGMHKKFTERPNVLNATLSRNANVTELENLHIELYDCDKKQAAFEGYQAVIALLLTKTDAVAKSLLDDIRALPADSVTRFKASPSAFLAWIRARVGEQVVADFTAKYSVVPESAEENARWAMESAITAAHSEALADFGDPRFAADLMRQSMDFRWEDALFQFRQGARMIGGVHRAYYLKSIVESPETGHDAQLMPIDVSNRGVDGRKYSVYMDNIRLLPNQATCDLYILLDLPHNGQTLLFEAQNIAFTPFGPLPGSPMRLQLGNDIRVRLNNNALLTILKGPNTFVNFDCGGFAGMGIAADVELCRDMVLPVDKITGAVLSEPKRVSGHFETYMPTLGKFYVEFDMDPFTIPGRENVKFFIQEVALDMSESLSPSGTPPVGYQTQLAGPGGFRPQWKGFYINTLAVRLPNKLSNDSTDLTLAVEDLVIDNMGVSVTVSATNLVPLSKGNAGGWAFSVDRLDLTVIMNQFRDAGLQGVVHVPLLKNQGSNPQAEVTADDCFPYSAYMRHDNGIDFTVTTPPGRKFSANMWKAGEVTLTHCHIQMTYLNNDFTTHATLSGDAKIDGSLTPNLEVNIPKISFQGVELSNKAPYFSPGVWSFNKEIGAEFGGFELTFSNIGMTQTGAGEPALNFNASIALGDATTKLGAAGAFRVVGELKLINKRQRWVYKKFEIDKLCVDAGFQGVANIKGCLEFFEGHATYGKGFRGALSAKFEFLDAGVDVAGQFGKVSGYKYFFFDALFCGNIPIGGALQLRGIGGGCSYHMNRPDQAFSLPACANAPVPSGIGQTLSGITYTPDGGTALGLRFTVAASIAKESAFNANATLEMNFTTAGALNRVWLTGNARFMEVMQISAPTVNTPGQKPSAAAVAANLDLSMDFINKHLHGQLEVFMNAGAIEGAGTNGYVGFAEVSFKGKEDWFIKLGSPSSRLGMKASLAGFDLAKLETYLQIGTSIDPLPPLPDDILKLTGATNLGNISRGMGNVGGFSFGADLSLGNKNFTFLIFNAGLSARLGFDMALNDFGGSAACAGTGSPVGINGWYAQGQMYAGVTGKIGIRVKVFGKRKNFDILTLAAAAVLQAKLPNPFWAEGAVGGQYSVMGGLVKGNCKLKFTIGQACTIEDQGDQDLDLPLILETSPVNNVHLVSVMTDPTVTFYYPLNDVIGIPDVSNTFYRMRLGHAKLYYKGYELSSSVVVSTDKRMITLKAGYALPARDTITLDVRAYVDSNGVETSEDRRIIRFVTGPNIRIIPPANVKGSYPLDGQYNFYRGEIKNGEGYMQLVKGQSEALTEENDYELMVRFQTNGGGCSVVTANYNALEKRVTYNIPSGAFQSGKVYRMQLLMAPKASANWGPGMTPVDLCSFNPDASGGTAPAGEANDGIDEASGRPTPYLLYTAHFRVSQFDNFYDKIGAFAASKQYQADNIGFRNLNKTEPFDRYELNGAGDGPLVTIRADLRNSGWIKNSPLNGLYQYYPATFLGQTIALKDYKPDEAVWIVQSGDQNLAPAITKAHYTAPPVAPTVNQYVQFDAPARLNKSYTELQQLVGQTVDAGKSQLFNGSSCTYNASVCDCFEYLQTTQVSYGVRYMYCQNSKDGIKWINPVPGNYPVVFTYRLPGTAQVSSIRQVDLIKQ